MRVIAVSNQKGGCGKTTTAINLAASLAARNHRTLLIDLDPQAHATFGVGHRTKEIDLSLYNVLTDQTDKQKFLEDIIVPIDNNLDLAPSHILLSTIEQEFSEKAEAVSKLYQSLCRFSFPHDFVIIDCPPSLGFLTFNALRSADLVIIPIELGSFSIMGVGKLLSMVELIRVKTQHNPAVWALATLYDARTKFSNLMLEETKKIFGDHLLQTIVRQSVAVRQSQVKGVPVHRHEARSKSAEDYFQLAAEIIDRLSATSSHITRSLPDASADIRKTKEFTIQAPNAREVYLVGDFNGWTVNKDSQLWLRSDGLWEKRLNLLGGFYRYKFIIDGEWILDPANKRAEPNPFGGMDSVIEL